MLKFPVEGSDRLELAVIKAQVARALNRELDETNAWREAMLEAERDLTRNDFIRLARMARQTGNAPVAADALAAACRNSIGILPSIEEFGWVIEYLQEKDRTEDLLSLTRRMLTDDGQNPVLLNNALYLSVITPKGEMTWEQFVPIAEDLTRKHPQLPQTRGTLALLYVLAGRPEDALSVYRAGERTAFGWQKMSASGRATYALVLAENGLTDPFRKVATALDWDELTTAERRFFENRYRPHSAAPESASIQAVHE